MRGTAQPWTRLIFLVLGFGALIGCTASEEGSARNPVRESADQEWQWDFDEDGHSDLIVREGDDVRFLVTTDAGFETVRGPDGSDLVTDVSADTTVTCSDDGVLVQTFEAADDESAVNGVRLSRLEVRDGKGSLVPSPSLFGLNDDFELPDIGSGCITSE